MWELDHKEGWEPKNWFFWTMVLEKTLESPSDCKEIKPVNPKGNQSQMFIGRTEAKAEAPIFWPPDVKNWLIGKDPDAGKNWRQEEKGMTEDEMVGWHHRLQWAWVWASSGSWWWRGWGTQVWTSSWHAIVHGVAESWTWLSYWTDWLNCSGKTIYKNKWRPTGCRPLVYSKPGLFRVFLTELGNSVIYQEYYQCLERYS